MEINNVKLNQLYQSIEPKLTRSGQEVSTDFVVPDSQIKLELHIPRDSHLATLSTVNTRHQVKVNFGVDPQFSNRNLFTALDCIFKLLPFNPRIINDKNFVEIHQVDIGDKINHVRKTRLENGRMCICSYEKGKEPKLEFSYPSLYSSKSSKLDNFYKDIYTQLIDKLSNYPNDSNYVVPHKIMLLKFEIKKDSQNKNAPISINIKTQTNPLIEVGFDLANENYQDTPKFKDKLFTSLKSILCLLPDNFEHLGIGFSEKRIKKSHRLYIGDNSIDVKRFENNSDSTIDVTNHGLVFEQAPQEATALIPLT